MAFNDYILLQGYRYKTLAKQWKPSMTKPRTPRITLAGSFEATFGSGGFKRWEGIISVPHGESLPGAGDNSGYGNIFSLRQALQTNSLLDFTDHNGGVYQVVAQGPFDEMTLINVWNSSSNKYYIHVVLTTSA